MKIYKLYIALVNNVKKELKYKILGWLSHLIILTPLIYFILLITGNIDFEFFECCKGMNEKEIATYLTKQIQVFGFPVFFEIILYFIYFVLLFIIIPIIFIFVLPIYGVAISFYFIYGFFVFDENNIEYDAEHMVEKSKILNYIFGEEKEKSELSKDINESLKRNDEQSKKEAPIKKKIDDILKELDDL